MLRELYKLKALKYALITIFTHLATSACAHSDGSSWELLPSETLVLQTSEAPLLIGLAQNSPSTSSRGEISPPTLSQVVIENHNIFDNPERPGAILVNSTHRVTRKNVIKREIWLQPGDPVTLADVNELERNLRKLNLFSEVKVITQPSNSSSNTVDLIVNTRDKLSLLGVAGGTFLGGIGEVGFLISETNFLGRGEQLQYRYVENSENAWQGKLSYTNILIAGDDTYAGLEFGKENNGDSIKVELENRFQNFDDSQSWKMEFSRDATRQEYYEGGDLVVQVPREDLRLSLQRVKHGGERNSSWKYGWNATVDRTTYSNAQGAQANTIDVPEDQDQIFAGLLLGRNRVHERQSVLGLDTLSYVQDVSLGYNLELLAGISKRETETEVNTLPVVFFNASRNQLLTKSNYFNAALESSFAIDNDQLDSWSFDAGFTWFNTRVKNHTTGARLKYRSARNRTGLPPQQLLGEDNGLRGYPAMEFSGEQSLLMNLEHRFKIKLNAASVEMGGVAFFDAGWLGDTKDSSWLEKPKTSAGVGLRFGSPRLLGSSVIRLDFAYPFDDADEGARPPTVSLAVGQVFGFNP